MAHPSKGVWLFCCSALFCLAGWSSAWASDSTSDEWTFRVTPYLWAVGMDGDVGLGRATTSVSDSFIDIMQDSDSVMAFMGDFSASKGRWSFFVTPTWAKLGSDDESIGPIKADVTETITIIGFGTKYRVAEWSLADVPGGSPEWANQMVSFDVLAGARYTHLKIELDFDRIGSQDKSKDWVDPFIGGVTQIGLTDKLFLKARADVGGFGVGSDVTWNAFGLLGYHVEPFGLNGTLFGGYRGLYQDYTDGSGRNKFEWNMTLHGPVLGLAVTF
jgi:hypothetical protein